MKRGLARRVACLLAAVGLCAGCSAADSGGRAASIRPAPDAGAAMDRGDIADAGAPSAAAAPRSCAVDHGGCDPLTRCIDGDDGVLCGSCPVGYERDDVGACRDIDECERGTARCSVLAGCENERGGYRCGDCPAGYDEVPEGGGGRACVDVDECLVDNGGCDVLTRCEDLPGGHVCGACPPGFRDIGADGASLCGWQAPALAALELTSAVPIAELAPSFEPDTLSYGLELPLSADTLSLVAELPPEGVGRADVLVDGEILPPGAASVERHVGLGLSELQVTVRAHGPAARSYRVVLERVRRFLAYVKAGDPQPSAAFASSLALARDGRTLAIGAPLEDVDGVSDAGAAYVFVDAGEGFVLQARLRAPEPEAGALFGRRVALSGDGDTLAVGAPGEDGAQTGALDAGAAYVYVRAASGWAERGRLGAPAAAPSERFGWTLALSADGQTLAVATLIETVPERSADPEAAAEVAGTAHVFVRLEDGSFARSAGVAAPLALASLAHLSLSADGSSLALAGVRASAPAFFAVYDRDEGSWTPALLDVDTLESISHEGAPLGLSDDGGMLVVGDPGDGALARGSFAQLPAERVGAPASGAVHVFSRAPGESFVRSGYLKASDALAGDRFGHSVALSAAARALAVGAPGRAAASEPSAVASGATFVFGLDGGRPAERERIEAPLPGLGDGFGESVALSASGSFLAVGAAAEDGAQASAPTRGAVDNAAPDSGAAYLFY